MRGSIFDNFSLICTKLLCMEKISFGIVVKSFSLDNIAAICAEIVSKLLIKMLSGCFPTSVQSNLLQNHFFLSSDDNFLYSTSEIPVQEAWNHLSHLLSHCMPLSSFRTFLMHIMQIVMSGTRDIAMGDVCMIAIDSLWGYETQDQRTEYIGHKDICKLN